jgi:hypothetical protein
MTFYLRADNYKREISNELWERINFQAQSRKMSADSSCAGSGDNCARGAKEGWTENARMKSI